jgi:hypothetical protein
MFTLRPRTEESTPSTAHLGMQASSTVNAPIDPHQAQLKSRPGPARDCRSIWHVMVSKGTLQMGPAALINRPAGLSRNVR